MQNMETGETELSDQTPLSNHSNFTHESMSVDSFVDEYLKNMQTCTHTHSCNPPGPDAVHTHTCYHTHTQVFTSEKDDRTKQQNSDSKSKKPSGNREAVRKYREKKKAHTAYLEEEVKKLQILNQQLVKKLQGQAFLKAEVLRLRSLLGDLRGKIDTELGVIHFFQEKSCSSSNFKEGNCKVQPNTIVTGTDYLQSETGVQCLHLPPTPPPPVGTSLHLQVGIINGNKSKDINWEGVDNSCHTKHKKAIEQNLVTVDANIDGNGASVSSSMRKNISFVSQSTPS